MPIMKGARSQTMSCLALLAASPALLAFMLALWLPAWRMQFLALLLLAALVVTLAAAVRVVHCLGRGRALALMVLLALSVVLPLAVGMLVLTLARLALLWQCRHLLKRQVALLAPGFPLLEALLVVAAALAVLSAR